MKKPGSICLTAIKTYKIQERPEKLLSINIIIKNGQCLPKFSITSGVVEVIIITDDENWQEKTYINVRYSYLLDMEKLLLLRINNVHVPVKSVYHLCTKNRIQTACFNVSI